jgi:hypothetical protein
MASTKMRGATRHQLGKHNRHEIIQRARRAQPLELCELSAAAIEVGRGRGAIAMDVGVQMEALACAEGRPGPQRGLAGATPE